MKNITILVPETAIMEAVADPRYVFTAANDMLLSAGKKPIFQVQLVGLKKSVKLMNGLATIHPDKTIDEVTKTDLIIIPALSGDLKVALELNKKYIPWIVAQHAKRCRGGFTVHRFIPAGFDRIDRW